MYTPKFAKSKNGVPILSNKEMEEDAEMFIRDFNPELLTQPGEVDIDIFSECYLGLHPRFEFLTSYGGILGIMVFNDHHRIPIYLPKEKCADFYEVDRGDMMIDCTLTCDDHRTRSTMGHECGHWIYHQGYYCVDQDQLSLFQDTNMYDSMTACRSADIEGSGRKHLVTDQDWMEHQANYFSASILMPRSAVKIVCQDREFQEGAGGLYPAERQDLMAYRVSEVFNVSEESARIRVRQLGIGAEERKSIHYYPISTDCLSI